ncbi:MAG: histidine triad nucleotide-binding protein [Patescibacteria group bacterium]
MDCIFCKIRDKEIPSSLIHEDDLCIVFKDINPKARVHLLIVPKKHIPTIADIEDGDEKIIGHLIKTAKELGVSQKLSGYRLQFNVGKDGGQDVFHVHLHMMAN